MYNKCGTESWEKLLGDMDRNCGTEFWERLLGDMDRKLGTECWDRLLCDLDSYIFTINCEQSQFYIPYQLFSFSTILRTVSDQTANVTLNSTAQYNHYLLITVHSSVYNLMFCSFHSKLHTNQQWRCHLLSMLRHGGHTFINLHTFLYAALDSGKCWVRGTGCFTPGARVTLDAG